IDRARENVPALLADARRRLPHLAYADLRLEVTESRHAIAENGAERSSGDDYACTAGVRVLAGDRSVAPGWLGIVLGAADVADLEARLREALERAYRRAMANAEHKATAREKFGPLGAALAELKLHTVDVRRDVVPAVYRIDPRSVPLGDMVAAAVDVSRAIAAAEPSVRYNWIPLLTQLTRELFASTEGAVIDQAFALTQGAASVVAVGAETSQELYDVMGHQRGWEVIAGGVDDPLLAFPPFRDFALALAHEGTPARRVTHIERGIFRGFMNSRQTAAVFGGEPNGHFKATSAALVPLIRMSNTVFDGGGADPARIVGDVDRGYYMVGHRI